MFEEMIMVEGQPPHWHWNSGAFKNKMLSSTLSCSVTSKQMAEIVWCKIAQLTLIPTYLLRREGE